MTQQLIVNSPPNSNLGDPLFTAFGKVNANFSELYASFNQTAAEVAANVTPVNLGYPPGEVQRQGVVGNGVTDDAAAFNNALKVGGWVHIPAGLNVLVSSAIAAFALSNTTLQIDGTLTLSGRRLTAYTLNNIHIVGTGKIVYSNTPTNDSVPNGWQARGVIEFGGTDGFNGTPIAEAVGFVVRGIEIQGDFNGTPGTITISPTDQRRCIIMQNAQNCVIESNRIHGSTAEATLLLTTVSSPNDLDIAIRGNTYYNNNHDCISQAGVWVYSFRASNNIMYASLNGIECNAGEFDGNYAFNMVGSGYGCGGNGNIGNAGNPVVYRNNVSRNNAGGGFYLQCAAPAGTLICQNNHSYNDGGSAFSILGWDTVVFTGNTATQWAQAIAAVGVGVGNSNYVHVDNNDIYAEGPNSTGGFSLGAVNSVNFGAGNRTHGVAIPFANDTTTGQGFKPTALPVFSQVSAHSLTGTTTPTTIYTATIPASALSRAGGLEIVCGGTLTGTAGTKVINIQVGGTTVGQVSIAAATTGSWKATIYWMNSGTSGNQLYIAETIQNNTVNTGSSSTGIATTSNVAVSAQVTLGSAADTVTMNVFVVKQLNGLLS